MEMAEPLIFGEAFVKDHLSLTFDHSLSSVDSYFSTSVRWIVRNDYVSFDLGETIFEQKGCMGYLKS